MKVLLITLHSQNNNFGSVLQAHSLYSYLTEMGLDVTVLDYRPYYSNGMRDIKSALKMALANTLFSSVHTQVITFFQTDKYCETD